MLFASTQSAMIHLYIADERQTLSPSPGPVSRKCKYTLNRSQKVEQKNVKLSSCAGQGMLKSGRLDKKCRHSKENALTPGAEQGKCVYCLHRFYVV